MILLRRLIVVIGCLLAWRDAGAQTFTEFSLPTDGIPIAITTGPDGNVWYTSFGGIVGKITPSGAITTYTVTTTKSCSFTSKSFNIGGAETLGRITTGPDGALWIAAGGDDAIARITTDGTVTKFQITNGCTDYGVNGIALGPDGNIWFTEPNNNKIGRMTTSGQITEFPISSTPGFPDNIVPGRDGNLWFSLRGQNKIGRITTNGTITEFPITGRVFELVAGPDGNIWYTQNNSLTPGGYRISKITPTGTVTDYSVPTPAVGYITSYGIAEGPDGNVWFAKTNFEIQAGKGVQTIGSGLYRITTSGSVTEFNHPVGSAAPGVMTVAAGNLYFIEKGQQLVNFGGPTGNKVGRFRPIPTEPGTSTPTTPSTPSTLRAGAIYSTAQSTSLSFLRFFNTGTSAGTVTVTLRNATSGAAYGTWTSPSIPALSEQQFGLATLEADAGVGATKPDYYTITAQSTFSGYFQHVLIRPTDGTLTNLSTCASGVSADATSISGVHTSTIGAFGYPSSIAITNTGTAAASASIALYDVRDGSRLGTYPSATIPAGGQVIVPVTTIEAGAGVSPTAAMAHYTLKAEGGFTGYLQHLLFNQKAGVLTDMTTACTLTP